MTTNRTTALTAALAIAFSAAGTSPASASTVAPDADSHCVAETVAESSARELELVSMRCFSHFDDVLVVLGAPQEMINRIDRPGDLTDADMELLGPDDQPAVDDTDSSVTPSTGEAGEEVRTTSTFTIGIHYDGAGFSGASLSVSGSNCSGGYLNLDSTWNNRVSSTLNGCPSIVHYDGFNVVGTGQTTTGGGGNLTYMDNRTSSIQYRS